MLTLIEIYDVIPLKRLYGGLLKSKVNPRRLRGMLGIDI
jgi:hypothetical protein